MSLNVVMEGLDALETEARKFRQTLTDLEGTEVPDRYVFAGEQLAILTENHARRLEALLTAELMPEEEEA